MQFHLLPSKCLPSSFPFPFAMDPPPFLSPFHPFSGAEGTKFQFKDKRNIASS